MKMTHCTLKLYVFITVVNVCKIDNGGCSQTCTHITHREYKCECDDRHVLDTDMLTCICKYYIPWKSMRQQC